MDENALQELLKPEYMAAEIGQIHSLIRRNVSDDVMYEHAFRRVWIETGEESKTLTAIDLRAEAQFIESLTLKFGGKNILVIGEESLHKGLDLSNEKRICVLVDMVDGTDLLERRMSNWCSAVVVFDPQRREILGAYVAPADELMLYFARRDDDTAYKVSMVYEKDPNGQGISNSLIPLEGIGKDVTLEHASVCVYGQKSGGVLRLLSLHENVRFTSALKKLNELERQYRGEKSTREVRFRFYNLAGNPMMVRLAEGYFDVVAEPRGQHPHDMAAGAFIAVKAKAVLLKTNDEELSMTEIADALCHPADESVSYILAANDPLAHTMVKLL